MCSRRQTWKNKRKTSSDCENNDRSTNACTEGTKISAHRQIVNLEHFIVELHNEFDNHNETADCQFKDWKLIKVNTVALRSQLFF